MKKSASIFGVALALAFVASPARADEKIFRLKNGRKVQGELLEETPTAYVVKSSGGKTTLPKESVSSVENVVPLGRQPSDPDPPKGQPTGSDDGVSDVPSPATATTLPSVTAGAALASESEIAAARKTLAAIPPTSAERNAVARHDQAIESAKAAISLSTTVAVLAQPVSAAEAKGNERVAALEIVLLSDAERVRPLLVRAVMAAQLEKGLPDELVTAISRVGPDPAGELESAVLTRAVSLVNKGLTTEPLVLAFRAVGSVKSLPSLFELLTSPATPAAALPSLSDSCQYLVQKQSDPEECLRRLERCVDLERLPDAAHAIALLDVLSCSKGEEARFVGSILDSLEGSNDAGTPETKRAIGKAYNTLAAFPTDRAGDRLVRGLRSVHSSEDRITILGAMSHMRHTETWPSASFLEAIVGTLGATDRPDAELKALGDALSALTGKSFGTDASAWQGYVNGLRR